ncbi:MAG: hypothetical protein KKB62_00770, partial [Nanoarchaeota archaeon]|nr:hypothetical protein [Nanoarchaeota archaeon]
MEFKDRDLIGIVIAVAFFLVGRFFLPTRLFPLAAGLGIVFGALLIVIRFIRENQISQEKEEMFLEFSRNLVE